MLRECLRWTIILAALLLPAAVAEEAESAGDIPVMAPAIHLKDQFRARHDITFPTDRPVLIGIADQHSYQHAEAWYNLINEKYDGEVVMHGVAALDDFFFFWRPWLKWYLRHEVEEPILLDWKNSAADAYCYREKQLCIYAVAPDGRVVYHTTGGVTEEKTKALFDCLDGLLKKETHEREEEGSGGSTESDNQEGESRK